MVNSKTFEAVAVKQSGDLASATPFPLARALRGFLWVPAGTSLTTVSVYGAMSKTGNYIPLQDTSGNPVQVTNIDGSAGIYALPASACGLPFVKLIGNADATIDVAADYDTAQPV